MTPRVSVVIPSRDRAEVLDGCLAALAAQDAPSDDYEIIVVDNGSTDDTPATVACWRDAMPNLRGEHEPCAGVSRARTTGIDLAAGDIVALLDDDTRPVPGWLRAVVAGFEHRPGVDAVCGPIVLAWPGPRPRWLTARFEVWYSVQDFGTTPRLLDATELPWAANVAVRRTRARDLGGFAEELDRSGTNLVSGGDVDFFARLHQAGGTVAYEPDAAVAHAIPASRVSRRWVIRRGYGQGITDLLMEQRTDPAPGRGALVRRAGRALGRGTVRGWRGTAGLVWRAQQLGYACRALVLARTYARPPSPR